MRSLRFSIAGLMGVVLLAAIAAAGVAHPTGPWAGAISLLTHGVICLAIVGAICRSGAERVWWLGFASFGWMYAGRTFLAAHLVAARFDGPGLRIRKRAAPRVLARCHLPWRGLPVRHL